LPEGDSVRDDLCPSLCDNKSFDDAGATSLDLAYAAFFDRVKASNGRAGFPRVPRHERPAQFFRGLRDSTDRIEASFKGMPGRLKVHFHRPLPADASIRSCAFTKDDRTHPATH
jgi:hypothetical protein